MHHANKTCALVVSSRTFDSSHVPQLIRFSFQRLPWSQASKSMATTNMRLGNILLPRRRRHEELLQQPGRTPYHNHLQRNPPTPNPEPGCRNHCPTSQYLLKRKEGNGNSRRCPHSCLHHDHRRPGFHYILDVQEGEETAQAEGALRGAVLANQRVPQGTGVERRILQRQCHDGRLEAQVQPRSRMRSHTHSNSKKKVFRIVFPL